MKHFIWLNVCCLLLLACHDNKKKIADLMENTHQQLVQDKQVGDTRIKLTYLPLGWEKLAGMDEEANKDEMAFRVHVVNGGSNGAHLQVDEKQASYGVDTLFRLILNRDTLSPVSAERIANGNMGGVTYLVIFGRRSLLPVQQAAFVFNDWLFTHTRLVFPLEKKYLLTADSLSYRP